MAYIDKMYFTKDEAAEFMVWSLDHEDRCNALTGNCTLWNLTETESGGFVANYPESVDWYLYYHCPLIFVWDRLQVQYPSKPPKNLFVEFSEWVSDLVGGVDEVLTLFENIRRFGTVDIESYLFLKERESKNVN